jgi:membrane-bound serine protease (ClpP class)
MRRILALLGCIAALAAGTEPAPVAHSSVKKVFVLPVREDIMPPLVYMVRRGVKDAMEANADLLVVDMETNGGRVDTTEEIIRILGQFKGRTVTFVNRKAFSAGAFISFATQKIYMAPQSVIGAAAPIMLSPGGTGVETMPDTMEVKTTSAISALVRALAEKNGHNVEVADAMVKKTKELKIDGKTLNEKGQILTLTNKEAEQEYGQPPKPLLSAGTAETIDALLKELGFAGAQVQTVVPTGVEKVGVWLNSISPLLLIIGIIGFYIEFKTPGFGLPGIVGIIAFLMYFLGGYIAGLSGMEWMILFVLGVVLIALELFIWPGVMVLGGAGVLFVLIALLMVMVDMYPGMPTIPTLPQLQPSIEQLVIGLGGSLAAILILSRILPRTPLYHNLVSQSVSGAGSVLKRQQQQVSRQGQVGTAISPLRPGGKARFGEEIVDVMSQGEMIAAGRQVRIIGYSGSDALVEAIEA